MKKTLIALMALAGATFGAEYTAETVWTLDFGSAYTNGYSFSGDTGYAINQTWDIVAVEGGTQTNGDKRAHLRGVFGNWETDFELSMTLTLGDNISASNGWPVFAEIGGNGTNLRFGPYTGNNNTVAIDGNVTKDDSKNNLVSVTGGGTYTITLTKIGKEVTVAVNGVATGYGVLGDGVTGNITDFTLGGDQNGYYKINEVVHSASWSILTPAVPEPTTATLSLLALAGLAARRRRK